MTTKFFTPTLIVKNITSTKKVSILNIIQIDPGETIDLFQVVDAQVSLFEDQIIKGLEKPWGDLYVESEIKRTISILEIRLSSWNYALVRPENLQAINAPSPGLVAAAVDDDKFEWVAATGLVQVKAPLAIVDGEITIPPADGSTDGYLTATDYARFDVGIKRAQKIWQYQDFSAPVGTGLTLTAFENGTGLVFDSSFILDGTAVATLVSDSSKAPTTTTSFPGRLLPGNRVKVSSHTSTTVVLDQTPAATQSVRIFYLISLPADVGMPVDYQEDPEFLNDASLDTLDELFVNQNQAESVYGVKTWEDDAIFNDGVRITTNPTDGYVLTSDALGNATWQQPTGGGGGGGDVTDAANVGTDGYGVFAQKSGTILQFKNIASGSDKVQVTEDGYSNIRIDVSTGGATTTIEPDATADEGTSNNLAREDHQHAIVTEAPLQGIGAGNLEGSATSFSRSDHDHAIRETGDPADLTVGSIPDGYLLGRANTEIVGILRTKGITVYDNTGGQLFTGTIMVNLDTVLENSDPSLFSLTDDQVTVGYDGYALINYDVSVGLDDEDPTTARAWLEQNTVEVAGTSSFAGGAEAESGDEIINTGSASGIIISVNIGDTLNLAATRFSGSSSLETQIGGSRLTIMRFP